MSLLENKKNNSRIKQLNQISEYSENNNDKIKNNKNKAKDLNQKENEEEEEDEEDSKNNNVSEEEYNEGNEEEDEYEEIDEENLSLLSLYKYKLNYDEKMKLYPRPETSSVIYKNSNSENDFVSNQNNIEIKPSVRAQFINIEESNSYIKLIRPSQYLIPNNLNKFYNTLNLFGLNIEPFSLDEKQNNLEFIQKIKIKIDDNKYNKILKCTKCNSYYHKLNFNLLLISDNNFFHIYKYYCFICKNFEKFFVPSFEDKQQKEENININKIFLIPQNLSYKPTIEYLIDKNNDNDIIKNLIQIIIIDLSNKDFVKFILETLMKKLNEINEIELDKTGNDVKYILIAYHLNKIYFIYLNKISKSLCISIMGDLKNPFCPVESNKLFCSKNNFIELISNFYNYFFSNKINFSKDSFDCSDLNNSIIKSIFSLIKINKFNENINKNNKYYFHLILFSLFNHNINIDLFKENKIFNIFLSFFLITSKKNINIPFIDNINVHNIKLYYFPIEYENKDDINQKYNEINIILNKLLNISNYIYEIKLNLCYDKNIFKNYNNNDLIYISFIPNKISLNKIYILPQNGKANILSSVYMQYNIEYYTFFDKYKHIRLLTLINKVSNDPIETFKSFDEEVLFRINLAYHIIELNLTKNNYNSINNLCTNITNKTDKLFSKIINNIIKKIKKTFGKFYKEGAEKKGIFIPNSTKLFPLYLFSFIKQISNGQNLNLLNLLYDCKLKSFIKNIYPNLLNIEYKSKSDKEKFSMQPLSISFMDRTQLLLHDDGFYITLLVNNEIKDKIKEHYLKRNEEQDKIYFKSDSYIINDNIKNKLIKIIFLNDNMILNKNVLNIFLEDKIIENINNEIDDDEKDELNNEYIQNDISYSDFYRIISQNLFEYFE